MIFFIGNILRRKDTEEMQTAKYSLVQARKKTTENAKRQTNTIFACTIFVLYLFKIKKP